MSRFFRGNYGSQLGDTRTAANLIAQAGATQGQALANMGGQLGGVIGGAIEKYQLNKEKQKENKATIKSSIGILKRMSKIDEANAPEYMASIQQLENEDIPLNQRGMLADKTLQGLSITNRFQSQMLSNQEKQQALALAKQLEASTIENAKLQNTNLGIKNDLANLAKRKGQATTEAEIRSILNKYSDENEIRSSKTAANISANTASSLQNDITSAYILGQGGPAAMAEQRKKDDDLKRRGLEADIRSKTSLADFRDLASQINVYNALNKASPSLAEQYKAEMNNQDELRKTKLRDPKEPGVELTYEEYLLNHEKDPTRYPLDGNNPAARLHGAILNSMRIQDELLKNKGPQVLANVPDPSPAPVQPGLDYNLQDQTLIDSQSTGVTFPQLYR